MFWNKQKPDSELINKYDTAVIENKSLKDRVKQLESQITDIYNETDDSSFSFDFNAVNAFSIERNWSDNRPCTIIGYLLDEQTIMENGKIIDKQSVKEWYLFCSKEQHEKLVEQFNTTKGK